MTNVYCFRVKASSAMEEAWSELEMAGIMPLYSSEDANGEIEIYAQAGYELSSLNHIEKIMPAYLEEIDWESQWATHGADYREGFVHVNLRPFGLKNSKWEEIKLKPGPGFGDLSHPTTRLVLELMADKVMGKDVVDIGCGSGVLSLAAVAMGAHSVSGVDIDPAALEHSIVNARVNGMDEKIYFELPKQFKVKKGCGEVLVLMNMIQSEQEVAWKSLKELHALPGGSIISGILTVDREKYLQLARKWKWTFVKQIELEGWLGMEFVREGTKATEECR